MTLLSALYVWQAISRDKRTAGLIVYVFFKKLKLRKKTFYF